jgi:FtsP/CotA-like multicopper oxidase with cupredoxin domain
LILLAFLQIEPYSVAVWNPTLQNHSIRRCSMPKVKLNIKDKSIPERIARGRQIVKALTGNPAFPNPQPALSVLTAVTDELETAYAKSQADRQTSIASTTVTHDKNAAFEIAFRKAGAFVESIAAADPASILSAGMAVSGTRGPAHAAAAPTGLTASEGDHDGTLDLSHDRVPNGKSYVYEQSPDPPTATSWVHAAVSTKSSVTISGLVSGTRYWFRVAAVTSAGQTGWSDPATKIAP